MSEEAKANEILDELRAIGSIIKTLEPFEHAERRRILDYVDDRLRISRTKINTLELTQNLAEALSAIDRAAKELNARGGGKSISGLHLTGVVIEMYEKAVEKAKEAQAPTAGAKQP